jgi:hypothetical protein
VVLGTCPNSYITAESAALLEEFAIILDHELAMEMKDGEQRTKHAF